MIKWIFNEIYIKSDKLLFIFYVSVIILIILITLFIVIKELKNDNK